MGETSVEYNLQKQIEENKQLKDQYSALQNNYNKLQLNYEDMVKRLTQIENQSHIQLTSDSTPANISQNTDTSNEISQMKSDALSASSSIKELQDVWSHVETQLESFSYRLDNIDQYMRTNHYLFVVCEIYQRRNMVSISANILLTN